MRWFKYLTTTSNDEVIAELLDRFGAAGMGVRDLILERIAQQMSDSDKASARYSMKNWLQICRISSKKFKEIIEFLSNRGKLSIVYDGEYLEIECPNLLKYRDEWSERKKKTREPLGSNSGETPEENRSRTELELEQHSHPEPEPGVSASEEGIDPRRDPTPVSRPVFEKLWEKYPKKLARIEAIQAWNTLRPDSILQAAILKAVNIQVSSDEWQRERGRYIPRLDKWIVGKRWQDELKIRARGETVHDSLKRRFEASKRDGVDPADAAIP